MGIILGFAVMMSVKNAAQVHCQLAVFFDKDDVWLDGGRFCGGCVAFGLCL